MNDETGYEIRKKFLQRYWTYYCMLEKDFLNIEQYITLDEVNFDAFSNEYTKQYQAICSEIDVVAKAYCKELDSQFKGEKVNAYCKCIIDNVQDFSNRVIKLRGKDFKITPWENWSYSESVDSEGKTKIESINPKWWKVYNKIKHDRILIDSETGLPYFKLANQKNVLSALAALFQLELYYYRLMHQKQFSTNPDMPNPPSQLFEIEDWGNKCITLGDNISFVLADR